MSPGAAGAPGLHSVMKNQNPCERAKALLNETVELLMHIEMAPASPFETVTSAKDRRLMERLAERLESGEAEPLFKNLYT